MIKTTVRIVRLPSLPGIPERISRKFFGDQFPVYHAIAPEQYSALLHQTTSHLGVGIKVRDILACNLRKSEVGRDWIRANYPDPETVLYFSATVVRVIDGPPCVPEASPHMSVIR